jgi:hypothetical protein
MIIGQGKKAEFKPYNKIANDVFEFRWGKEDIFEKVHQFDEKKGEWVLTGEVKETSLCTYEVHRFFGSMPTPYMLTRIFNMGQRVPSMSEMKAIGEVLGMTEAQMLPWMKEQLKRAINKHDKSRGADGVENFTIGGVNLWLDKETRTGLLLRFQAEKASGKTDTILWHEGMQFPLVIEQGIQMLYAIEVYASATYDKKEYLLSEVDKLASVDALIAYDYKSGYPAQLAF